MLRQRQPRVRNKAYLGWIARLPCVTCGREPVECAHVRMAAPEVGKRQCGKGEKPSDWWALPLCPGCHRLDPNAQHTMGEREWWEARDIDPIQVCLTLQALHDQPDSETEARAYLAGIR